MAAPVFDQIADVYDETRRALDETTLKGINDMLGKYGCSSILEIGVGTGRIALPLIKSGYEVIGMDISRRMMEKARAKGMPSLFLAEGSKAPFREKSFDATLMAHVFHLLDNPQSVMREAARMSRVGVFALVRKRTGTRFWSSLYGGEDDSDCSKMTESFDNEAERKFYHERRARFRKIFEKYGWNPSQVFLNWRREQEILETYPPDDLKVVSEVFWNENMEERISRFEKGSYSSALRMPPEMRKEIIEEMRSSSHSPLPNEGLMRPRHEVYQVALWKSNRLLAP
ncbi:MAG TPA: class I SAM-dependent methyltransferase [Nitrososphaerales archaeon]|nr:class I SAM-dependent methyltransferase [Nitrososphaerales archaeon]